MKLPIRLILLAVAIAVSCAGTHAQIGHVLDAVGAVNQSMGGAGTALPLDATGALHWNPASITDLPGSEIGFSFQGFATESQLSSAIDANTFGPGVPGGLIQGTTKSDTDINPIPALSVVHKNPNSPWSFGLGGYAIGGAGVDYPVSGSNPILTPQPADGGFGFGAVFSQYQVMQFAPTVARSTASGWSFGIAPTINWASLAVSPFSATIPNGNGTYPSAAHSDSAWGLGVQAGVYYRSPCSFWNLGLSYKSQQWFQDFKFNGIDEQGRPRNLDFDLDFPSILSLGLAYRGFERARIACDVRYIDYENTDGFQESGFDETGAVLGFGWSSIWSVSTGVEYAVLPNLRWRAGYTFNQNPISSRNVFYNIASPAVVQNHLSTGFTWLAGQQWLCTVAYHHGFRNSVEGNWWSPAFGKVSGARVESTLATHGLVGGISRRF